jgi:endonuclease YncB( thermonuclease family)
VVVDVSDGDTFRLDRAIDGATDVKLVGIQAPQRSVGRPDRVSWPLADQARDILAALVLNQGVVLEFMGPRMDRHGRLIAQVYRDDGTWIQGDMLKRGMARVLTFADNRELAAEMLMLEENARERGLGIWSDPFYAVRTPEEAGKDIGSFQLVEGRVMKAARVKNYVYLNFGKDWRTDFTVSVPVKHLRQFTDAGLDLLALSGQVIRVRGWLKEYSGPMIDATHPEQIEVLEADTIYPERIGDRGDG